MKYLDLYNYSIKDYGSIDEYILDNYNYELFSIVIYNNKEKFILHCSFILKLIHIYTHVYNDIFFLLLVKINRNFYIHVF